MARNIYGLLNEYNASDLIEKRIVGAVMTDLIDRKGIGQSLHEVDGTTMPIRLTPTPTSASIALESEVL